MPKYIPTLRLTSKIVRRTTCSLQVCHTSLASYRYSNTLQIDVNIEHNDAHSDSIIAHIRGVFKEANTKLKFDFAHLLGPHHPHG